MNHAGDLGQAAPGGALPDPAVETVLDHILSQPIRYQIDSTLSDAHTLILHFKVPLAELAAEPGRATTPLVSTPTFRKRGQVWQLVFEGRESFLPDMRGLSYICCLLAHAGEEVAAQDLILKTQDAFERPEMSDRAARAYGFGAEKDLGSLADAEALNAARTQLRALEQQILEAESCGDTSRAESLKTEKSQFVRYLAETTGLRGKPRRAGSKGERARQSCRSAITAALRAIEEEDSSLAQHLRSSVRTGSYCRYQPKEAIPWQL